MILEIGCGDNPDPRADVRIDVRRTPYVDVQADAHLLPFKDDTFDAIVMNHVLEHLDVQRFIREARRVLKPKGKLYAKVPFGYNAIADPTHRRFFTIDSELDGFRKLQAKVSAWVVQGAPFKLLWWLLLKIKRPGKWLFVCPFVCGEIEFVWEVVK